MIIRTPHVVRLVAAVCTAVLSAAAVGARSAGAQAAQPGPELSWAGVFVPQSAEGTIASRMFAPDTLRSLGDARPLPAGWGLSRFGSRSPRSTS